MEIPFAARKRNAFVVIRLGGSVARRAYLRISQSISALSSSSLAFLFCLSLFVRDGRTRASCFVPSNRKRYSRVISCMWVYFPFVQAIFSVGKVESFFYQKCKFVSSFLFWKTRSPKIFLFVPWTISFSKNIYILSFRKFWVNIFYQRYFFFFLIDSRKGTS